jgi:hypothetical protein
VDAPDQSQADAVDEGERIDPCVAAGAAGSPLRLKSVDVRYGTT